MHTFITALLLVVVLAFPITFVLVVARILRRHGIDTHQEPPDTIDYDKW